MGSVNVGGVCGKSSYLIENCVNTVTVYGNKMCGGIAGYSELDVVNSHCIIFPEATENVGMIVGFAKRPVSSYSLNTYSACGNLPNRDEYLIQVSSDGVYTTVIGGKNYLDILNLHIGCITSDTYYDWQINEGKAIVLSSQYKTHNKIVDGETNLRLSGSQIKPDMKFNFSVLNSNDLGEFIAKVNYNKLFQSSNLFNEDIIFVREVSAETTELVGFSLTMPISVEITADQSVYDAFSKMAILNYSGNSIYVYVTEYLSKTPDGNYVGALKCMYHSFDNGAIVKNGELSSRSTFVYDGSSITFSSDSLGIWAIADITENEQIVPIETGTAEITMPIEQIEETSFDFGIVYTVIVFVLVAFAALAITVIQRSKNNVLIFGTDED